MSWKVAGVRCPVHQWQVLANKQYCEGPSMLQLVYRVTLLTSCSGGAVLSNTLHWDQITSELLVEA